MMNVFGDQFTQLAKKSVSGIGDGMNKIGDVTNVITKGKEEKKNDKLGIKKE